MDAAYVGSGNQTCFAGNPPLSNKTLVDNAVLDMGTAYGDAAGRTGPTATELGAGNIGGMTLAPGLYKWSTDVSIPTNVTLSGGPNDVWIFQIAGNLAIASGGSVPAGIKVVLIGGAQASNIFWQVGGVTGATLGTYSTFNGNILAAKEIIIQTGAVLNGRALAQTQVTLDATVITDGSLVSGTLSGNLGGGSSVSGSLGGAIGGGASGSIGGTVTGGGGSISGTVGGGSGGGGIGGGSLGGGQVLGASTDVPNTRSGGQVLGASTDISNDPGVPNTGAGGNASENVLILVLSAFFALGGAGYLLRRLSH